MDCKNWTIAIAYGHTILKIFRKQIVHGLGWVSVLWGLPKMYKALGLNHSNTHTHPKRGTLKDTLKQNHEIT